MITTIAIIVAVLFLSWVLIKTLWRSRLFWIAALALAIILMPLTAGLSPVALFLILLVRFYLIHRVLVAVK